MGDIHKLRGLIRRVNNIIFGYKTRTRRRKNDTKKRKNT